MPLNFTKKPVTPTADVEQAGPKKGLGFLSKNKGTTSHTPTTETSPKTAPTAATQVKSVQGKPSFLKRGAEAQQALDQADARAEQAKSDATKLWRFWMPHNTDRKITFLDGEIGEDGLLDCPMFNEHHIKHNGEWTNVMCIADQEPCPCCEAGGDTAKQYLCGALTILDHTPYTVQSGKNAGKIIVNSRKLFVGSRTTIKLLTKIAMKRGGLTGATFDVTRTGDKEPGVGNQFDFTEKNPLAQLMKAYALKEEEVTAADYEVELAPKSAEEMVSLGYAKSIKGIGSEKGISKADLSKEL